MRILAVSDKESPYLWDYYEKEKLEDVDMIISCGDLDPDYLSFLVTMTNVPVFYVSGNHDKKYLHHPPEGCTCIDDKMVEYQGVRIIGFGGSMRYHEGPFQFTEWEMRWRVIKLWFSIFRHRGFDILVTHAPAYQVNDGEDLPHRGFQVFRFLMDRFHPKYFLHGHVHLNYKRGQKRIDNYGKTVVINAFERHIFDYDGE